MAKDRRFPAVCQYCGLRIAWNKKERQWDRLMPNKTFEDPRHQYNTCGMSESGWHDPDPRQA